MKLHFNVAILAAVAMGTSLFAADEPKPAIPEGATAPVQAKPVKIQAVGAPIDQLSDKIKTINAPAPQPFNEVIKMSDAGIDEKTILSYIDSSPGFVLKADDIIALHEHGISSAVITAMLQHPPKVQVTQPPVQVAQAPAQAQPQQPVVYQQPVYVTSPEVVYAEPYGYGYPSVVISGGFYYSRPYFYGGFYHRFPTFYGHRFPIYHHFSSPFRAGFHRR